MSPTKFNPLAKKGFDKIGMSRAEAEADFLKLDQTTPQTILNDTFKLDTLKSKATLGTDANGKIIEGTSGGQFTFVLPGIAGSTAWVRIPHTGTITGAYITGDISGSAVVDLWIDTFANFPPTVADTITASAKPTLSSARSNSDTTLTGWTKTLTEGNWIMASVDSASTLNTIVLVITYSQG